VHDLLRRSSNCKLDIVAGATREVVVEVDVNVVDVHPPDESGVMTIIIATGGFDEYFVALED
jgi:hypothetical protein